MLSRTILQREKMAEQMYLEFPIKLQHVEAFKELCNSAIGFALTKKQPGFVSAEWMISTSEDGSKCLHLWEKWESSAHFAAYMKTPERAKGSKFELSLSEWGAGETKVYWGVARPV
jgi:quinol monooxygenase YgiN